MKVHVARGWLALSLISIAHCAAETRATTAVTTKKVAMRTTIIPEWDDVAKDAAKLTADTVASYWNKLEQEDLKHYSSPLPTKNERKKAKKSINDFYNSAAQCLGKNYPRAPVKKASYASMIAKVHDCISKDATMPKFIVTVEASEPTVKPTPTVKPSATPIQTAKSGTTLAPTAKPSITPAPTVEDTSDDDTSDTGGDDGANDDTDDDDDNAASEPTNRPASAPAPEPTSVSPTFEPMISNYEPTPAPESETPFFYEPTTTSPAPEPESPTVEPMTTVNPRPSSDSAPVAEYPSDTSPKDDTLSPDGFIVTPSPADPMQPSDPVTNTEYPSASPVDDSAGFTSHSYDESTPTPSATGPSSTLEYPSSDEPMSPQATLPSASGLGIPSPDANTVSTSSPSLPGGDVTSDTTAMPMKVVIEPVVTNASSSVSASQQQNAIRPARDTIPDLSVLDVDNSGGISVAEWSAYVEEIKGVAQKVVAKCRDPLATPLLDQIVAFHYDTLQQCIQKNVVSVSLST